ncbi:MAG: ATP-binding protein [Acidimicrobiia bacterium]
MTKRLILSYLAVTVLVLVLLEVPFAVFYAQRELDRLTAGVERDASVIATIYEDDLEAGRPPDPQPAQRYADRTGARVVVVDTRGISVVDTAQTAPRDFSTRPEVAAALTGSGATGTRPSETLGTELLYVAIPVASSGTVHGALRLTLDTTEVDERVRRFWWGLAATAAVVLASITLIGWLIARSITQPLRRLNTTARRFGSGDLTADQRDPHGPPELRELADTMSTMAGQLAAMIDQQRAFVADASHQLRTPLTGLRLRLENLQASLSDADDAAQVELAIDEISRLSTLVSDLLQLARTDRHETPVDHDLTTIVADRVDTWSAAADIARIRLDLCTEREHLTVLAVPGAIEQILDNVFDNALGIAPPDTTVTITVEHGTVQHRLTITDEGPGLSDDDKDRALRRFWRGDTQRPGSGLGLAIADGLARASGGSLTLHDGPTRGLRVVVTFPASTPDQPHGHEQTRPRPLSSRDEATR